MSLVLCEAQDSIDIANSLVAGVDEVGRGPLAGPVVAAAVILDPLQPITGLNDSKALTEKKRLQVLYGILETAIAVSIIQVSHEIIDRVNILQASLLAMQQAISELEIVADFVYVDGNMFPKIDLPGRAVVKGDQKISAIAAASVVAKVFRDIMMVNWDVVYPQYGFSQHKGYPTKQHIAAINEYGITEIHRKSFGPIKKYINQEIA